MSSSLHSSMESRVHRSHHKNPKELKMLDYLEKPLKNRWTAHQQMLLCCLQRFFDTKGEEKARIFNHVFSHDVKRWGFNNGLPDSTVVTQLGDLQRHQRTIWILVQEKDFAEAKSFFAEVIREIRFAARDIGIHLVERQSGCCGYERAHLTQPSTLERLTGELSRYAGGTFTDVPAPSVPTMPVKPKRIFKHPKLLASKMMPTSLLFRFSNDQSRGINHRNGYLAGNFITERGKTYPPETYKPHEMQRFVEAHAQSDKYHSPFISASDDPLVVIHRGLRQNDYAMVSIIDPEYLDNDDIFSMRIIREKYHIDTHYKGSTEFWIWGMIPNQAIVNTFRIDTLKEIANMNPNIQSILKLDIIERTTHLWEDLRKKVAVDTTVFQPFFKGCLIGRLFQALNLQSCYIEDIARLLNKSWGFVAEGHSTEYINGIWEGFGSRHPPISLNQPNLTSQNQPKGDGDISTDENRSETPDNTPCPRRHTRIAAPMLQKAPCALSPDLHNQTIPSEQHVLSSLTPENEPSGLTLELHKQKAGSQVPYQEASPSCSESATISPTTSSPGRNYLPFEEERARVNKFLEWGSRRFL